MSLRNRTPLIVVGVIMVVSTFLLLSSSGGSEENPPVQTVQTGSSNLEIQAFRQTVSELKEENRKLEQLALQMHGINGGDSLQSVVDSLKEENTKLQQTVEKQKQMIKARYPSSVIETRDQCIARLRREEGEAKPHVDWKQWATAEDSDNPIQKAFIQIYETNFWAGAMGSGPGSELYFAVPLRCHLSWVIAAFNITTIVDAPCGDFWYMRHFLDEHPHVNYIGVDIVPALIRHHSETYKDRTNWEWFVADLTEENIFSKVKAKSKLWGGNVLINTRHAIEHNAMSDQTLILRNINNAPAKYWLGTTHPENCQQGNTDKAGGFSQINFRLAPHNLPVPIEYLWERDQKFMGLWTLPFRNPY